MAEILDRDTALLAATNKLREQAANKADINIAPQPVEPVATPESEPAKPVAIAEPEKEKIPIDPPKSIKEEVAKPTEELDNWDDTTATIPVETNVNFEKLGSALKLEGIKSESEFVAKFNQLNTELSEYKQKAETVSKVPDELKQVLEVAAKGGDWKSYINPVDYSKVDPVALYEHEVSKLPQFRNPDGSFNKEKFEEVVDAIPENQKELEGSRIAQQRQFEQNQFRVQQQQILQQRRDAQDRELAEAAKELPKLFPVDQFGLKLDNRHSEQMYKGISDGSLLKKHFLKDDGSYDYKKVVATLTMAEFGQKMMKHLHGKATVAAKKEILQATTNPQLSTSSKSVAPEVLNEKPLSPAEKLLKHTQKSQVPGSL